MSRKKIYTYSTLLILVLFTWLITDFSGENNEFSERVKISLRDAGNQLLLANRDSTSLILPVIAFEKSKYELSFEQEFSFEPSSLVSSIKNSFQKGELPEYYRVEVIQCTDKEVAYSYEMNVDEESTIIPCGGRFLPENCYNIEVTFVNRLDSIFNKHIFLYIFCLILLFFILDFFFSKKQLEDNLKNVDKNYAKIGSYQFYPEQNKLVKAAIEINLSKKECELLEIFVANPNQIIKRDELEKRVWEDNGVIVGRSLDTYISKLRKKLKDDTSIKLTNVHGIGYKLELLNQ